MAVGNTIIKQDEIQVKKLKVDNITTNVQVNNTLFLNGEKSLSISSLSSGTVNVTTQEGGSVNIDLMQGGSNTIISQLLNAKVQCSSLNPPSGTTGEVLVGTINSNSKVWVSDQLTLSGGDVRIACGEHGKITGGHIQVGAIGGTINGGKVTVGKMSSGEIIQEGVNGGALTISGVTGGSVTINSLSGASIKIKSVNDLGSYVEFDTFTFNDSFNARELGVGRNDKHLSYVLASPGFIYIINARHGSNYTGIFFWDPDKGGGKSSAGMIINGWTSSDSNKGEHRQIIVEPCDASGNLLSDFNWANAKGFRMYLLNIEDSWHTGSGRGGSGVYTEEVNGESSQCWSVWMLPIKMNLNGYADIT